LITIFYFPCMIYLATGVNKGFPVTYEVTGRTQIIN